MPQFSMLRVRALWRRLSAFDIAAVVVAIAYVLSRLGSSFGIAVPFSEFLGFLFILAIAYGLFRLTPWVRTKLLWSLRNRLIVAYLFIAVVPVVLLLTMATLGLYLIYMQFGAHILRDDVQERIAVLQGASRAIRSAVVQEALRGNTDDPYALLTRPNVVAVIAGESSELPGLHVEAERTNHLLEKWGESNRRRFAGMVEIGDGLWLRCDTLVELPKASIPLSFSVPVNSEMLDDLNSELGPINLTVLRPDDGSQSRGLHMSIDGREFVPVRELTSRRRTVGPRSGWLDYIITGGFTWEAILLDPEPQRDDHGQVPVLAAFSARPSRLNQRLFASLGDFGPLLTLMLAVTSVIFLVLEAGALITGVILTRRITSAVADLYDATGYIRRGDFTHRVRVQRRDQLGALGESFNEMTSSITELIEEQRKGQRLENEISIAREVQEQLFPQSIPQVEGVELAAICRAARVVSGDYYDFIRLSPCKIGIAVADISGKGISAALLMASLQAALRSQAVLDTNASTAQLVSRLNHHLFHNTSDDRYATFFYAVFDSNARTLEYTNAGHCAPVFVSNGKATKLDTGGTVVGLFDEAEYESGTINAPPDSLLVVFSDGLIEPENVYGEEFGTQRLTNEILRHRETAPQRMAESLIDSAEQWAGTPEQADDMTVVVARLCVGASPRPS
ncbi:MAG TPA: SpoIIE family protein phosphatase [Candidatus Acidoferrales bacterium]